MDSKPDFTGVWQYDAKRSRLEIAPPESSRFEIEHQEPRFRLRRTLVYGGVANTMEVELTLDGVWREHRLGEIDATLRGLWDGAELVFEGEVRSAARTGTNVVRYSLEDAGRTLVALERFQPAESGYENRWVFARE